MKTLAEIQAAVKAPKGNYNSFGKYKYRKAEDILEALKPVINPHGFHSTLTDEIVLIGDRFYIKAIATISNGDTSFSATAYAREEDSKSGMAAAQVTGSTSSYARKYALSGLLALDDNADADDADNSKPTDEIGNEKRDELHRLLESSTYDDRQRVMGKQRINGYNSMREYETAKNNLLQNQLTGFDSAINPSNKDIAKQVKQKVNGTN